MTKNKLDTELNSLKPQIKTLQAEKANKLRWGVGVGWVGMGVGVGVVGVGVGVGMGGMLVHVHVHVEYLHSMLYVVCSMSPLPCLGPA